MSTKVMIADKDYISATFMDIARQLQARVHPKAS